MGHSLRERVKSRIPAPTRNLLRRQQARLRWVRKYQRARSFGRSLAHDPATVLKFVVLDPEVENFTYEIENERELAVFLARALGVSPDELAAYIDEAQSDPELTTELDRRVRWRWDTKRHLPLGRRLGWYAVTRLLKPKTTVETGIHAGLGSLAILRALERNSEYGAPGELISFDMLEGTGWLVPTRLRPFWTPVYESTLSALDRTLEGRSVDLLIQDLGAGYEAERHDYEAVSRHASDRLVLIGASGHLTTALRDFSAERGLEYRHFIDVPHRHVFSGSATGIAVMERHPGP